MSSQIIYQNSGSQFNFTDNELLGYQYIHQVLNQFESPAYAVSKAVPDRMYNSSLSTWLLRVCVLLREASGWFTRQHRVYVDALIATYAIPTSLIFLKWLLFRRRYSLAIGRA